MCPFLPLETVKVKHFPDSLAARDGLRPVLATEMPFAVVFYFFICFNLSKFTELESGRAWI